MDIDVAEKISLFFVIIGGETNFSTANNQPFNSKSKTYCQKTTLYLFQKMETHELKSVSRLIIKYLLIQKCIFKLLLYCYLNKGKLIIIYYNLFIPLESAPVTLYLLRYHVKCEVFANKFKHHEIVFYQTNLITLHQ